MTLLLFVLLLVVQQEDVMSELCFDIGPGGKVIGVSDVYQKGWTTGRECKSYEDAERLARLATEDFKDKGDVFLAVDRGSHTWPRYDVVRAPKVGTPVSKSFNGDSYPDGVITKVGGTECSRIYTSTGSKYNRRRKSATWVINTGTFMMISGHHDERNPSF